MGEARGRDHDQPVGRRRVGDDRQLRRLTWMPGVETCELDGDDRVLRMFGMRLVEHQYSRDDEDRTLTYGIVDGDMKPEVHRATDHGDAGGQRLVRHLGRRDRRRHGGGDAGRLHRRALRSRSSWRPESGRPR